MKEFNEKYADLFDLAEKVNGPIRRSSEAVETNQKNQTSTAQWKHHTLMRVWYVTTATEDPGSGFRWEDVTIKENALLEIRNQPYF